ncbi:MAG TPA: Gfo/Idh/MocA family oxidoreductase, partial [Polyangia bacterium]|nr:Gfo/Idh/MocA family oxidoreductase [Polyangia bacterium]
MTDVSVCFLGCGAMTRKHIRTLRRLRARIRIGVASRDEGRARAFAQTVGAQDSFRTYQAAIESNYDVMAIVVPPRAHHSLVERALKAGKHLLIEKPVFSSLEEFESLWPQLKASAGTVMVAENLHFAPFQKRLARRLQDRKLGQPLLLELTRLGRSTPKGWRADPAEMDLGALHEGGVHWIRRLMDLAAVFEADPVNHVTDVTAFAPPAPVTGTPGEDTMLVVARHKSGLTSRLLHTWAVPWRFPPFDSSKVLLEHGALYFDARGLGGRFYGPDGGGQLMLPSIRDAGGFGEMWRHFLGCVESGSPPALSLEHVFADFAYMDAAYRSAQSRTPAVPRRPPVL